MSAISFRHQCAELSDTRSHAPLAPCWASYLNTFHILFQWKPVHIGMLMRIFQVLVQKWSSDDVTSVSTVHAALYCRNATCTVLFKSDHPVTKCGTNSRVTQHLKACHRWSGVLLVYPLQICRNENSFTTPTFKTACFLSQPPHFDRQTSKDWDAALSHPPNVVHWAT